MRASRIRYGRAVRRLIGLGLAAGAVAGGLNIARRRQPPKSLEEQVRDGLKDPVAGWWVELVLDAFGYLVAEFGYSLAEVQMHFKGNYIVYRGPVFEFHTEYDPDATHSINAELWVVTDAARDAGSVVARHPRAIDVNRLLRARDSSLPLPDTTPARLDRARVAEAVAIWAQGLREKSGLEAMLTAGSPFRQLVKGRTLAVSVLYPGGRVAREADLTF